MSLVNLTDIRLDATLDAPASPMAAGIAVKKSGTTIALAGAGDRPYGFLRTNVTSDGLKYEELKYLPHAEVEETKVSVGKVSVVLWEPGMIATDNIKGAENWAVGDKISVAANGELSNAGAANDVYVGIVTEIDKNYGAQVGTMQVITLSQDLGLHA